MANEDMTMREKIAERLMRHYAEGGPWDGFMEADIVLDALMEPTTDMIAAGDIAANDMSKEDWSPSRIPERTWKAMIRAAKENR